MDAPGTLRPHVREARAADIDTMVDLLAELFALEAEFAPDPAVQRRALVALLGAPQIGTLFVAEVAGATVGMVSLLYTLSTALGGRVAWLEDMVVARPARARGVGDALIAHAVACAQRHGCARVSLLTDADNVNAQRFYGRAGFTRSPMVLMRRFFEDA